MAKTTVVARLGGIVAEEPKFVFFDLETTGLIKPDIIQLSAVTKDRSDSFDEFIKPQNKVIEVQATAVHGIILKQDGHMYKISSESERLIIAKPVAEVLVKFINWLRKDVGAPVVLVAYNGFRFDAQILLTHLRLHSIKHEDVIRGFIDPFRFAVNSGLNKDTGGGRRQTDLMKLFDIHSAGDNHNALYDAENLRQLTLKMAQKWPELLSVNDSKHFATLSEISQKLK